MLAQGFANHLQSRLLKKATNPLMSDQVYWQKIRALRSSSHLMNGDDC
jgi:hypothetical protein